MCIRDRDKNGNIQTFGDDDGKQIDCPIVVLVDENSASASVTSQPAVIATSPASEAFRPVSYTHLDVYKRQVHCLCILNILRCNLCDTLTVDILEIHLLSCNCLLYTSRCV